MNEKDRRFHHNIVNLNCLYDVNHQFFIKCFYHHNLDNLKYNNQLGDFYINNNQLNNDLNNKFDIYNDFDYNFYDHVDYNYDYHNRR